MGGYSGRRRESKSYFMLLIWIQTLLFFYYILPSEGYFCCTINHRLTVIKLCKRRWKWVLLSHAWLRNLLRINLLGDCFSFVLMKLIIGVEFIGCVWPLRQKIYNLPTNMHLNYYFLLHSHSIFVWLQYGPKVKLEFDKKNVLLEL